MRYTTIAVLLSILVLQGCATPYSLATRGDAEGLRRYLAQGGDPDRRTEGWTALHAAARNGRADIVSALLAEGADINAREDGIQATALYIASQFAHADMVRLLLDAGADPQITSRGGSTTLQRAAESKCAACVKHLLAAGVDPNAGSSWSALYGAMVAEDVESARLLLASGANINSTHKGMTPLYVAAQRGNIENVRLLLDAGAELDLRADGSGATALYAAAEKGHLEVVRMLIAAGAGLEVPTTNGSTALMRAVQVGAHPVVGELLRAGANPNARGGGGGDWTPLLIASWVGDTAMMERLSEAGADRNARRNDGRTVDQMFNRRALDAQKPAPRPQPVPQQQPRQQGGFQWGKFAALTVGAAAGGLDRMDSQAKFDVMSGIVQDSMAGNTGVSNTQAMANGLSAGTGTGNSGQSAPGGTYPPRPNILAGHQACAGYTVDNYKTRFEANRNGPDVQLHTHCAGAYNYYWMYLNAIRQGYSQADSDRTYNAFHGAAQTAIHFYQTTR